MALRWFPDMAQNEILRKLFDDSSQEFWPSFPFCLECSSPDLYVFMSAKSLQSCPTLRSYGLQFTRLLCPWDSPGKNTGVGWHALLQGIFLTQGSNLDLLHNKWIIYHWATREAHTSAGRQAKLTSLLQRWCRDYNWCSILCRSWPLAAKSNLVSLLLLVPLPFCHHENLSGALVTFKPCL